MTREDFQNRRGFCPQGGCPGFQLDSCSKAFYSIIIPDSDLFQSSTYLNSQGSIQLMLPLKAQNITQTHSHHVLSGSHFYGWVNQSPHDGIAASGTSNQRPFAYESYVITAIMYFYITLRTEKVISCSLNSYPLMPTLSQLDFRTSIHAVFQTAIFLISCFQVVRVG